MRYIFLSFLFLYLGCEEIVLEADISDKQLVVLAPTDNAQFNSTSVTFTWEPLEDATKYQIQIAKPTFENATEIILNTETTETTFTQQLNVGTYEWRIRALNSSYSTPFVTRKLTVLSNNDFSSNVVVLNSPTNNLITNTASQQLSWSSIIGATSYQLQIFDNSSTLVVDQNLTTTTYNYTFTDNSFTWKVRATNGSDYTLYSSRTILVDTTSPNTPTLTAPVNNSSTSGTSVTFNYSRTPINGSTEFDSLYVYTDSNLSNLFVKKQITNSHTETIATSGTYFWRMKAFDAAGNSSSTTNSFSFTIN
ncbi:hypothetical protein [Flavobacterium sp. 9AF]|uniref:hypothetical protein n=1 Tax=Flavobacterium sp. 9AF TaxID=2653142 RepID=UPI001F3DC48C|nr:hypothetical protein [Flavobacterium sp. 9AF]